MVVSTITHESHIAVYYLRRWYYEQIDAMGDRWAEYYFNSSQDNLGL